MGNLLGSEHSFSALVLPGSWFYFRALTLASLSAREYNVPCLQCFPLLGFCSSLVRSPWLGCLCSEQMPGCNLMCLHLFLSLYLFAQRIARSAPKMYSAEYFFKTTHLLHPTRAQAPGLSRAMPASSTIHVLQLLRELLAFVLLSYTVLIGALLLAGWTTYFLVLK